MFLKSILKTLTRKCCAGNNIEFHLGMSCPFGNGVGTHDSHSLSSLTVSNQGPVSLNMRVQKLTKHRQILLSEKGHQPKHCTFTITLAVKNPFITFLPFQTECFNKRDQGKFLNGSSAQFTFIIQIHRDISKKKRVKTMGDQRGVPCLHMFVLGCVQKLSFI